MSDHTSYEIYTAAACSDKVGRGGAAFIITKEPKKISHTGSCGYRHTNMLRMKVMSIILALRQAHKIAENASKGKTRYVFTVHITSRTIYNYLLRLGTMQSTPSITWPETDLWKQVETLVQAINEKGSEVKHDFRQDNDDNQAKTQKMADAASKMAYCTDEDFEVNNPYEKPKNWTFTIKGEDRIKILYNMVNKHLITLEGRDTEEAKILADIRAKLESLIET